MDYRQIGKRIRNIRKSKGLTQERLAELADISLTHMSHIETGTTKLSLPVLVKISETLRVSTDELLFGNIETTKNIALNDISHVLEQCTDKEVCIISDILIAIKVALNQHR